jgi:hypothetical protein
VSPILGIWASAQQAALLANSYESISTVNVGAGGSTSISFSSIPSTYKHLQLRVIGFMASNQNIYLKLNGNDGTKGHTLQGDGTSAISEYYNNSPIYSLQSATGRFASVTDILDYATTTKNKTIRSLAGGDNNGSGRITLASGFYDSTSAITSFTVVGSGGGTFTQYSQFALYGIRG